MWEKQVVAGSLCHTTSSSNKGMRELRNIVSTVNYDGQSGRQIRKVVNLSGLVLIRRTLLRIYSRNGSVI